VKFVANQRTSELAMQIWDREPTIREQERRIGDLTNIDNANWRISELWFWGV